MDHTRFHHFVEHPNPGTPLADRPDWDEIMAAAEQVRRAPINHAPYRQEKK